MTFARDFALWEGNPRTALNVQWMEYGRWMEEAKDRARDALAEGHLDQAISETRWALKYMFWRKWAVEEMKTDRERIDKNGLNPFVPGA